MTQPGWGPPAGTCPACATPFVAGTPACLRCGTPLTPPAPAWSNAPPGSPPPTTAMETFRGPAPVGPETAPLPWQPQPAQPPPWQQTPPPGQQPPPPWSPQTVPQQPWGGGQWSTQPLTAPARQASRGLLVLTCVLVALILAGGGVGVGVVLHRNSPPSCPGCGGSSVSGDPLSEAATYTSPDLKFSVDYPDSWQITAQAGDGVSLHTSVSARGQLLAEGVVIVKGDRSTTDTAALIDKGKSLVPSSFKDLQDAGPIRGAHIADADGDGRLFTATFTGSDGNTQKGAVAIVAASKGGLGVVVVAGDGVGDQGGSTPLESSSYDYVLTEFRWPS